MRVVQSTKLLTVEYALKCLLWQEGYEQWTYYMARAYVERYDPHQGTGICRESAPMLWEIVRFWDDYYLHEA